MWDLVGFHGFTGHPDDFSLLRAHLIPHRWHGPVLFGHERLPPANPALPIWPSVVASLADTIPRQSVLMGYSMGGRLALSVATLSASHLRGLVLIGATPGIEDTAARRRRREDDEALAQYILSVPLNEFLTMWSQKPIIASQHRIEAGHKRAMRQRKSMLCAEGLAASLQGVGTGSMPPMWQSLPQLPTLLITGREDTKFTDIAAQMCEHMPNAQHAIVDGAGHCAHLEKPAQVGALINGFMAALPPLNG